MRVSSLKRMVLGASLALGAIVSTASTASAQDKLNFAGSVNVSETGEGATLLLDFLNPVFAVPTVSGIFSSFTPFSTQGVIGDISVSTSGCANCTINSFLAMGGYVFNITATGGTAAGPFSFGPVEVTEQDGNTKASLAVFGTVTGPGLTGPQDFSGIFTAQFSNESASSVYNAIDVNGETRNVGFSAEFTVNQAVIPEPSTYALMAFGLVGMGVIARRRRTA